LRLASIAATGLGVGYYAASTVALFSLTRPGRRRPFTQDPGDFGLSFDAVTFPSRCDGLVLSAWLIHPSAGTPGRRPVIMVHGWKRHRQNEVGGRILEVAAHLARRGHPVLLMDLRGWGESAGVRFTLGVHEVRDVGGAIDFLAGIGCAEAGIILFGYSMGGASALLLAPGERRVRAVISDSAYADLSSVLSRQMPRMGGLLPLLLPGVKQMARLLLGVDVDAVRPVDQMPALGRAGTPLLVMHGESDTLVPVTHGHRIAQAYGPGARACFVPGADHCLSYTVDPARYLAAIDAHLDSAEAALASGPHL
jgi:pimeloyl-ACP methyl ester carboxylesterase